MFAMFVFTHPFQRAAPVSCVPVLYAVAAMEELAVLLAPGLRALDESGALVPGDGAPESQVAARVMLRRGEGGVERYNLGHVADRVGIGRMGEHGALADAYAAYDVLVKLLELAPAPQPQ